MFDYTTAIFIGLCIGNTIWLEVTKEEFEAFGNDPEARKHPVSKVIYTSKTKTFIDTYCKHYSCDYEIVKIVKFYERVLTYEKVS